MTNIETKYVVPPPVFPVYFQNQMVIVPLYFVPEGAYDPVTGKLHRYKIEIIEDPARSESYIEPEQRDCSAAWCEKSREAHLCLVPWCLPLDTLKQIVKILGIPPSWLSDRLQLKAPSCDRKKICRSSEEGRKIRSLTLPQFKLIRAALRKMSKESALICEILWLVNNIFGKGGAYIALEDVLRLQIENVSPRGDGTQMNRVVFFKENYRGGLSISTCLSTALWKRLCAQIKDGAVFVFETDKGRPILPMAVDNHIRIAAQQCKLCGNGISSLSFRPPFDKKIAKDEIVECSTEVQIVWQPVSEEEFIEMCHAVPGLVTKKGRKPKHDHRILLNAILFHFRERCSFSNLPECFPPSEAVKSQYRRWAKNKIMEAIFSFRLMQKL